MWRRLILPPIYDEIEGGAFDRDIFIGNCGAGKSTMVYYLQGIYMIDGAYMP